MKTIYQAKQFIHDNFGKRAIIRVYGLRNRTELYEGIICECYRNIFILETKMGKKSFNYSDVLVGNVRVKIK